MLALQAEFVGPWVCERTGGTWTPGRGTAVGWVKNKRLVAGVLYEDYNVANIVCHIAGEGNWACREYLSAIFDYPFNQLKVNRITVPINSNNEKSIRLVEAFGFRIEAKLAQATPDGDLLIYRLFKDECKYLKGKYKWESQARQPHRTTPQPQKKPQPVI